MAIVFLGLGSNLGNREDYLNFAITSLEKDDKIIIKDVSSIMETSPLLGGPKQGPFLNIVLSLETEISPEELLIKIQKIENAGNRVRDIKWGPRTIDIDILLYGEELIQTKQLEIPHKEMINRNFVLKPLVEINPDGKHPKSKKLFKDILIDLMKKNNEEIVEII